TQADRFVAVPIATLDALLQRDAGFERVGGAGASTHGAVTGALDELTVMTCQGERDDGVMLLAERVRGVVADAHALLGGTDDVGEEHCPHSASQHSTQATHRYRRICGHTPMWWLPVTST